MLHTLKHRVKYVFPSCSATQLDKLEEFITHIQFSGDPTDEDGQLGRVLYVGALIKSEGEGNEGRDAGLQRVVYVIRHLDATTNGAGRKAHVLKDRTLLMTESTKATRHSLVKPVKPRMASSGEQGCGKHHNWHALSCRPQQFARDEISLMKPAFVWLGFRGPDCNVIAEKGGGPDARPSWAGSGPRAGGCPTLH